MRKIINFWLVVLVAFVSNTVSQDKTPTQSSESWEYLIVSVSNFNDKSPLNVSEKWMGRRQGNVGFFQDVGIQNEFDRLGKLGWELVGTLTPTTEPSNNIQINYSKFIFKRKYDTERSKREIEEQSKLLDEFRVVKSKSNIEFIELDYADSIGKEREIYNRVKSQFETSIKKSGLNLETRRFDYSSREKFIYAEIVINASAELLKDGNKYRLSEARKYLRQISEDIFNKSGMTVSSPNAEYYSESGSFQTNGNVKIYIGIAVKNGDFEKRVTNGYITGNLNIIE